MKGGKMISIRNIELYLNDHLEIPAKSREEILRKAKSFADPNGVISGGAIEDILGNQSKKFLKEIMAIEKHIKIALEDIKKSNKSAEEIAQDAENEKAALGGP
jgi:hypothetical protein